MAKVQLKEASPESRYLSQLAIFGGKPTFSEPVHVGRPNIGNREDFLKRVNDILDRKWLTNSGPYEQEFERRVADFCGVKHCISMCNGTTALAIAIRAIGLTGEVIIPSFTFVATAHALQWQEITPVFCDIQPDDYNIDPEKIEGLITPKTSGIIGVHLWGRPCNIDALESIAKRNKIALMFDAAHAFGCAYQGKKIGSFGHAEVLSFHATKMINSLEGGAVVTNDTELAQKLRLMKNFGFSGLDNVIHVGTNGKMDEVSAAMGITSLDSFEQFRETNRANFFEYKKRLSERSDINFNLYPDSKDCTFPYISLEITGSNAQAKRDLIVEVLHKENIMARRYFYPACHNMEPYRSYFPNAHLLLQTTEDIMRRIICLPSGTAMSIESITKVCQTLTFILDNFEVIAKKLKP